MKAKGMSFHEHITSAYIIALLTIYLFIVGKNGYQTITAVKYSALCWICGSYIALSSIASVEQIIVGARPMPSLRSVRQFFSIPRALVLAYLFFTWLSAILSDYWPDTLVGATRYEGAISITLYCGCFLLVSKYGNIRQEIVYLLGFSLSIFSTVCIIQIQGTNLFGLFPEGYSYLDANVRYYGAYVGTVGNVDIVASLYSLVIPFLAYYIISKKENKRFFLLIPLLLSLYVAANIRVSAGYVGIAVGCVIAFPLLVGKSKAQRLHLAIYMTGAIMMLLAIIYLLDIGDGMFHEFHEILHGNFDPNFGTGRIYIWTEVLKRVPKHLWFGSGPDTMAYEGIEGFIDYDARLGEWIAARIDIAHNEYLNVLYHQGILALIAYVSLLFSVITRTWIKDEPVKGETAALSAGIIGYSTQAFFGSSVCIIAPYFWLTLALVANDMQIKSEGSQKL